TRQDQGPPTDPQTRGRALPPLRHHPRGRLLLRTPDELLPPRPDQRPRPQRPPPVETPEVGLRFESCRPRCARGRSSGRAGRSAAADSASPAPPGPGAPPKPFPFTTRLNGRSH